MMKLSRGLGKVESGKWILLFTLLSPLASPAASAQVERVVVDAEGIT